IEDGEVRYKLGRAELRVRAHGVVLVVNFDARRLEDAIFFDICGRSPGTEITSAAEQREQLEQVRRAFPLRRELGSAQERRRDMEELRDGADEALVQIDEQRQTWICVDVLEE